MIRIKCCARAIAVPGLLLVLAVPLKAQQPPADNAAQTAEGPASSASVSDGARLTRVNIDVALRDGTVAKQRLVGYEIIHSLEPLPPELARRAEPLPVGVPIPVFEVHNNESPLLRGGVTSGSATAIVYRQPHDCGYFYPFAKGMDIGNYASNPLALGNGFQVGDKISGFDVLVYNSVDGFGEGGVEVSLWDGDPWGILDTSVHDPPQMIPGTLASWTGLAMGGSDSDGCWEDGTECTTENPCANGVCDGGFLDGETCADHSDCGLCPALPGNADSYCAGLYRLRATFDPPIVMPSDQPWIVMTVTEGCRLGWRWAWFEPPDVGRGGGWGACAGVAGPCTNMTEDFYEHGQFYDGSTGTCCDTGEACDHTNADMSDDCSHPSYCSSGVADTRRYWWDPHMYYLSFVASAYAPADTTVSLFPKSSSDPGATIVGNEIKLAAGGAKVWLHIEVANWDTDLDGDPRIKTWQATIDPSGYTSGLAGFLTPWNPNCVGGDDLERDAYCAGLLGNGSWCDELGNEGYPPTQCCPGFQDSTQTPNLLLGINAVSTSSIDFAYGSMSFSGGAADTGVPVYGGTLVLDVDSSAKGTFTIPFIPETTATFMKDTGNQPIPLVALVPAKITIELCNTLDDYPLFEGCLTGPGGVADPSCACPDDDADGDVDLADFARFQLTFVGKKVSG